MLGKGGAGKSCVAAGLGLATARAGLRTLVVEVAGQHRLSRLFAQAEVSEGGETELAPGLFGISIDSERATEEYLSGQLRVKPLVELLTRSRAFHHFTSAAPGLAELVSLGKIWSLAVTLREDGAGPLWDRVVVDCPATGHGIAMLETAANAEQMAGGGPIRSQAARIQEVISHPAATGVVMVARPQELSVTEATEAAARLRELGLPVAAAVLNAVHERRFEDEDLEPLARAAAGPEGPARAGALAAMTHRNRRAADLAWGERLAEGTGLPVVEVPEIVRRRFDLGALERVADALAAGFGEPGR